MSARLVIDASLALAWVLPSQATKTTDELLEEVEAGARPVVPSLWPLEVANALLVLERRRKLRSDDRKEALRHCEAGIRGTGAQLAGVRRLPPGISIEEAVALLDIHTGSPEDVIASLKADTALARATDWSVQVHSIDPPHPYIMRSIELVAEVVAPALGWQPATGGRQASASTGR